jgi:hypothetical protein
MLRALLIVGVVAVIPMWSIALGAPQGAQMVDAREVMIRVSDGGTAHVDRVAQASEDDDDSSMRVMLWTVLAAGIAAGVGLVLYMVRVVLGRVQVPPTQQQDDAHH